MTHDLIDFGGFHVAVDLDQWPAKILRALLRRHYERHELRLVSRLLEPGDRVIELGSAIGVVALASARIVAPEGIGCFDANPEMVTAARANFTRNGKPIHVENTVLMPGKEVGKGRPKTTFYVTPYFLSSSLIEHRDDMTAVQVPNASLEAAIAARAANVAIVDIEGGEFALLGAADLAGIETLILELHVGLAGVPACLDL
ncbi:MAG: FkbM family methyltransferase, partial [Hyphomicrobiales bacterium]